MSDLGQNDLDLTITVTGDDASGRKLVSNIISDALEEAGFAEVVMVNTHDEPIERDEVPSLLELIANIRPEIFNQTVTVRNRGTPEEELLPEDVEAEEEIGGISPEDEALGEMMLDSDGVGD